MNTGRRVSVDLNSGRFSKVYGISMTEPYFTKDGIALTGSLTYRDVTQFVSASSDFSSKSLAAGLELGYPITEFQTLRFGLNATRSELLTTSSGSAQQAQNWVQQNGKPYSRSAVDDFGNIFEFFGSANSTMLSSLRCRLQYTRAFGGMY